FLGILPEDAPVILDDIAPLRQPLTELARTRSKHEEVHGARLAALLHRLRGRRCIPHVADETRAEHSGKARPDHEDVRGEVGRLLGPDVRPRRQLDDLPAPLEDRRGAEIDVELASDGRMIVVALEQESPAAVAVDHAEVVGGAAPEGLVVRPARRNASSPHGRLGPVLDYRDGGAGDGGPPGPGRPPHQGPTVAHEAHMPRGGPAATWTKR